MFAVMAMLVGLLSVGEWLLCGHLVMCEIKKTAREVPIDRKASNSLDIDLASYKNASLADVARKASMILCGISFLLWLVAIIRKEPGRCVFYSLAIVVVSMILQFLVV